MSKTISKNVMKGIVHGKTIELEEAPGLPEGQVVTITVEPAPAETTAVASAQEAMQRAFGAWAEDAEQLDQFLDELRRLRKLPRRGMDE